MRPISVYALEVRIGSFWFLGILFELQSPGWGIPGTFGAVCLTLSLSASVIVKLATKSDLLIVLVGLGLLMVEAFLIPGFGVAGLAGIVVILWGLYMLLLPDVPVSQEIYDSAMTGLTIGLIGAIFAGSSVGRSFGDGAKISYHKPYLSHDAQKPHTPGLIWTAMRNSLTP